MLTPSKHNLFRLCIILFWIIIFLVIGEIGTRLYLKNKTISGIEMTKYALILKKVSPNPLIGHEHKPSLSAKLMNVTITTNSDGFRDREYPLNKGNNYRMIFLGDSMTLGWGVEQEDTFADILEKEINKTYPVEIINFGTGNYNTEQEVNLFLEKGLKYHPDKVVVFYFINDAEPTPTRSPLWILGHSRLLTTYWMQIIAHKNYREYYSTLYEENKAGWSNAQKALLQLQEVCLKNNIQLQVFLIPELHNLTQYPFKKEQNIVMTFLKTNSIQALDLTPYFEQYTDPKQFWVADDDAHLNKLAHQLTAKYVSEFVAQK